MKYFIGIDVGSKSSRGALINSDGTILQIEKSPIAVYNYDGDIYEQSSSNIWQSLTFIIKKLANSKFINVGDIVGIGFGATCSLVALDKFDMPMSISLSGDPEKNIIMWMDHRAKDEADLINSSSHSLLYCVGGKISLEMEPPKLLWLKKNIPNFFNNLGQAMDLADFLTFYATGNFKRSTCTISAKWLFQTDDGKWDDQFFKVIGLNELTDDNYQHIGREFDFPGNLCATLKEEVALEWGLSPSTAVSMGLLDAYCSLLGALYCKPKDKNWEVSSSALPLVIIGGTSSCLMMVVKEKIEVPGVWGPYKGALFPDSWILEGGQSAAGALLDHILKVFSPNCDEPLTHSDVLETLESMRVKSGHSTVHYLTKDLHIYPDFHGNRSPLADSSIKGMILGLTLQHNREFCSKIYLATIQALAYSTLHIIQTVNQYRVNFPAIHLCGGFQSNLLYAQTLADVTNLPVLIPECEEIGLLGAAMIASVASRTYNSLQEAAEKMSGYGSYLFPNKQTSQFHNAKFAVYHELLRVQNNSRELFSKFENMDDNI